MYTLTRDRHSHTLMGEQADTLAVLPDLSLPVGPEVVSASGTDGQAAGNDLAFCLALSGQLSVTLVDSDRPLADDQGQSQVAERTNEFGLKTRPLGVFPQLVLGLVFKTSGRLEESRLWVRFPYTPAKHCL